ncbi:MAG TPA: phosphoenolpyruvate carboxykinase domain-containing protein, partial [Mycobacteriales bacterium]|nr:phosphoenolpyruvate carboxykinase domain-containing protein [Mycobacteriales bacterium]
KWIVERLEGTAAATETPIGNVPTKDSIDLSGLDLTDEQVELLLTVDKAAWRDEAEHIRPHYERFGTRLPQPLWDELDKLSSRLS